MSYHQKEWWNGISNHSCFLLYSPNICFCFFFYTVKNMYMLQINSYIDHETWQQFICSVTVQNRQYFLHQKIKSQTTTTTKMNDTIINGVLIAHPIHINLFIHFNMACLRNTLLLLSSVFQYLGIFSSLFVTIYFLNSYNYLEAKLEAS